METKRTYSEMGRILWPDFGNTTKQEKRDVDKQHQHDQVLIAGDTWETIKEALKAVAESISSIPTAPGVGIPALHGAESLAKSDKANAEEDWNHFWNLGTHPHPQYEEVNWK